MFTSEHEYFGGKQREREPSLVTTMSVLEKCGEVEVYIIKYGFIACSPFLWDLLFADFF